MEFEDYMKPLVGGTSPLEPKQIFFTNLQLLGFEAGLMEKRLRIPVNKDMFIHPNKKGFEVVMHYLFNCLDPTTARDHFRNCWPINDKKDEQNFRKVCTNWLTSISKEDPEAHLPRIVASLFMSPGGAKFYQLLQSFSTYVLLKVVHNEHGVKPGSHLQHPVLTRQCAGMGHIMGKAVQCGMVRHRQKFLEQVQGTILVQNEWKSYAGELVRTNRGITKAIKDVERSIQEEIQKAADKGNERGSPCATRKRSGVMEYDFEMQGVKRAQKVQKVRDHWKCLDNFLKGSVEEKEIVESVMAGAMEKYKIDATQFDLKVPGYLLTECENELQRRHVDNVYQGGKVNLVSVLHLWNLSLHLYIEKLHQAGVPTFEEGEAIVSSQNHIHAAHLQNAKALEERLTHDVLPDLQATVNDLKGRAYAEVSQAKSPESIRTTSLGLGLLPPTPPVNFGAATPSAKTSDLHSLVNGALAHTPDQLGTPEGAARMIETITKKVRQNQPSPLVQGSPVYANKMNLQGQPSAFNSLPQSKVPGPKAPKPKKCGSTTPRDPNLQRKAMSNDRLSHSVVEGSKKSLDRSGKGSSGPRSAEATRTKTVIKKGEEVFKAPSTAARKVKKPSHDKSITPRVEKHVKPASPKAHDILADQIVDAMMDSSPRSNEGVSRAIDVALDTDAFESKEMIARTPATAGSKKSWHDTLLHDSVGPLSSTRIENGTRPVDKEEAAKVALRLFSGDEGDDEAESLKGYSGAQSPRSSTSPKKAGQRSSAEAWPSPRPGSGRSGRSNVSFSNQVQDYIPSPRSQGSNNVISEKQHVSPKRSPSQKPPGYVGLDSSFSSGTVTPKEGMSPPQPQGSYGSLPARSRLFDKEYPETSIRGIDQEGKLVSLDSQYGGNFSLLNDENAELIVHSLVGLNLSAEEQESKVFDVKFLAQGSPQSSVDLMAWSNEGSDSPKAGLNDLGLIDMSQALEELGGDKTPELPTRLARKINLDFSTDNSVVDDDDRTPHQSDEEENNTQQPPTPFQDDLLVNPFKGENAKPTNMLHTQKMNANTLATFAAQGDISESSLLEGVSAELVESEEEEVALTPERVDDVELQSVSEAPLDGTARLLEFQDGEFNEYLEHSPGRLKQVKHRRDVGGDADILLGATRKDAAPVLDISRPPDMDEVLGSPYSTPSHTPIFGLSSMPMSPTTAQLHQATDEGDRRKSKRLSGWDDILNQDDSILLPPSPLESPRMAGDTPSPAVGNLIDF